MSDQDGEKTAAEKTESSSQTRPEKAPGAAEAKPNAGEAPHHIEEAEAESELPEHEDIEDSELEADPEPPEETETHSSGTAEPPPEKAKRRGGFLKLVAYLIALSLAGGGGYYLWNAYFAMPDSADTDTALTPPEPPTAPEQKAEAEKPAPAPETAAAPQTPAENSDTQSRTAPPPPPAPQTAILPPPAVESPKPAETEKPALAAEPSQQAPATKPANESSASEQKPGAAPVAKVQGEGTAPADGAVSELKPAASPSETASPPSAAEPAKSAEAAMPAPAPAPVEATKPAVAPVETSAASAAAANPQTTAALATMSEKLAAADATIETLSQRLQTVENQLVTLASSPRAAPAASEPAARLAVAQSLLNAMRQGDDYSAQIAAMQNLGADPEQLARLRAGLSAPGVEALAKEFAALAPKLVEASAPAKRTEPGKPPRNLKDAIWAQVEMEANKLVRIRPAGSAEQDAAAATVATIEKDLRAGDLSGALAERQQLAPAARSLSDQWAASVQTRIEAESAAKAALNAALRNLTKPKT